MLILIFCICMLVVFGKLIGLAFRGAWGLTKILFTLVFFPFILIGLVFKGLLVVALPLLIIVAALSMIEEA